MKKYKTSLIVGLSALVTFVILIIFLIIANFIVIGDECVAPPECLGKNPPEQCKLIGCLNTNVTLLDKIRGQIRYMIGF